MSLTSLLTPERVNLELKGRKKNDVLKELVGMVKESDGSDSLLQTLLKREELGSTGIGKGIAIPHGRSLLRISLSWSHTASDLEKLVHELDGLRARAAGSAVAPPSEAP